MYSNSGSEIKSQASWLCGLKIFFDILLGIAFLCGFIYLAGLNGKEWPDWLPGWFLFVPLFLAFYFGVGKSISAWNQHLFMAAYGELVEETTKSAAQLEEIKGILKTIAAKDTVSPDPVVELKENTDLD